MCDLLSDWKFITALGGVTGFLFGVWRYSVGQRWQKMKVLLELVDSFKSDNLTQAACTMLDWDERKIKLTDGREIDFKNSKLTHALRVSAEEQQGTIPMDRSLSDTRNVTGVFDSEQTAIRDCFDKFFDFFDKVEGFRKNKLVKMRDLTYFNYWFELVRQIGRYKGNSQIQTVLENYIEAYNFHGFQNLLDKYRKKPITLYESKEQAIGQP